MRLSIVLAMFITVSFPRLVVAEVMDKMPTVGEMWATSTLLAAVAVILCCVHRWFAYVLFPLAYVFALGLVKELSDTSFGGAVLREAGLEYILHSHASAFLPPAAILTTFTVILCLRDGKRRNTEQDAPADADKPRRSPQSLGKGNYMSKREGVRVVRVGREDLPKLEAFLRKDAAQAQPGNPGASQAFVDGVRKSLDSFDFLSSDSHWLLAAEIEGEYVGYLNAVRIHKADGRVAVLYVDELMVLDEFRRRKVATALWQEVHAVAREIGAWRVRVTVGPDNNGAREFYQSVGLEESPLVLCQQKPEEVPNKTTGGDVQ